MEEDCLPQVNHPPKLLRFYYPKSPGFLIQRFKNRPFGYDELLFTPKNTLT